MNKKRKLFLAIMIGVLIVGCLLYFRPLKLADLANETQYIVITYQELGIKNGSSYMNSTNYNEITEDEKSRIIDVLKQHSYKRTFRTFFSDGSLTELGDEMVSIYIYDETNKLINTIFIAGSDHISVNGKVYTLKKSSAVIEELLGIVNKSCFS